MKEFFLEVALNKEIVPLHSNNLTRQSHFSTDYKINL